MDFHKISYQCEPHGLSAICIMDVGGTCELRYYRVASILRTEYK